MQKNDEIQLHQASKMEYNNLERMSDTTKIYLACNVLDLIMLFFVLYMLLNMQRKIILHEQELTAIKSHISTNVAAV